MNRRGFLQLTSLALLAPSGQLLARRAKVDPPKPMIDLGELLEGIRKEHSLPGLAAAAMHNHQPVAEGVAGVRRLGQPDAITLDDRFAIGSCTKLMTGLLIGRLIDAGKLSFETKLPDALPGVKMADDYRGVTVAQVLNFTGGIQPYTTITKATTPILFEKEGTPAERRLKFVEHVLDEEPIAKPGTQPNYSNAGYVILGQIAAACNQSDFEAAMQQHVFAPLALTRAGFGRPCTKDRPNEPWLHVQRGKEYEPEADRERPAEVILAAAGDVHCSIRELAKFASYELLQAQEKDPHLRPATAKRLYELMNPKAKDDFSAFGGTPWLAAGVNYVKSENLAIVFAINAGFNINVGRAILKAIRDRVNNK